MSTEALLAERRKTHGDYREHAAITRVVLEAWAANRNWSKLTDSQKETLHMIAHKVGRIVTGDPNVKDHWDDIAGYATLISQQLGVAPFTASITVTNTDTPMDQYRRYATGARRDARLLSYDEWLARQAPQVPREDSNRHAFQEPSDDGA